MFRLSTTRLCSSVAAGAAGSAAPRPHSFEKRLEEMRKNQGNAFNSAEYAFMREQLSKYSRLQQAYAVKQTDVERARKAAHMCGLEFTGKKGRMET